ncbi:MAG: pitrilysin family protein [Bacteroidales bacterium]|nr:pitrilysin family protein [Bacteroidales bacterium]
MIAFNTYRLKNGLRLLHYFDKNTQMVALNLLYDVGARDEDPSATGLAHLFEHLMFTGSKHAPSFDAALQAAGGSSNAWTSNDMTNYYETLPAHNVETAFWLESDRLRNLNLTDESIDTQKSVVIEEFKQRCLNVPYGDLHHISSDLAFKVHPYRWPTIGLRVEDIQNASHDAIKAFFASHYAVNNLILCVSGHVEFDRAVALAEKWFGDFAPVDIPVRNLPQEPVQCSQRFLSVKREVPQNMIMMMYHMCGRGDADYQACDMLSDVLSNGPSSRFYRNVMVKSGLFSELDASVTGTHDPGLFLVRARLADGVSFAKAQQAIDAELKDFLTTGATAYEMEKCANKYESTQLFDTITYEKKGVKLCQYELLGSAADINSEVGKYRSLTQEGLMTVAHKLFDPANCSVLYYGPDA